MATQVEPGPHRRPAMLRSPRSRAMALYVATGAAVLFVVLYAMLRVGLCWGRYGLVGVILCKSNYIIGLLAIGGLVLLAFQIVEIGRPHRDQFAHQRFTRGRAALHGFRQLERPEAGHVAVSGGLLLLFVAACLAVLLVAPVLF